MVTVCMGKLSTINQVKRNGIIELNGRPGKDPVLIEEISIMACLHKNFVAQVKKDLCVLTHIEQGKGEGQPVPVTCSVFAT